VIPVRIQQADNRLPRFPATLNVHGHGPLRRAPLAEVQVNLGRLCNQACTHCHVDAGPKRTEIMTRATMDRITDWIRTHRIESVDITGGAPEINPGFREFVDGLIDAGCRVKSRCNLTVLQEPGQEDLHEWYAARRVHLVCSLPCYSQRNVDQQRGKGVFERSIDALQRLNASGYGSDPALIVDLVYNPNGAFLPPHQASLESDYRERLGADFGITFNRLYALANLPVNRFDHYLRREGKLEAYLNLLVENFNPETVEGLMCRHLISVDWLGRVFDCDFNQMLELPLGGRPLRHLWEIDSAELEGRAIATDYHCFGCTAGAGSSCGGALAA